MLGLGRCLPEDDYHLRIDRAVLAVEVGTALCMSGMSCFRVEEAP